MDVRYDSIHQFLPNLHWSQKDFPHRTTTNRSAEGPLHTLCIGPLACSLEKNASIPYSETSKLMGQANTNT